MNDSFVSTNQNTEIDSINSYFECITECSIVDGHQECITRCLEVHWREVSKMNKKNSPQRKTTLKWNSNGELSEIDMLRILEKISSHDLNQCELTCDSDTN